MSKTKLTKEKILSIVDAINISHANWFVFILDVGYIMMKKEDFDNQVDEMSKGYCKHDNFTTDYTAGFFGGVDIHTCLDCDFEFTHK